MLESILARHGESTYSARQRANGDPTIAVPLTAEGRRQARDLAQGLAHVAIDRCIVSPFPRTRETAEIALAQRTIPLHLDSALDDLRYGIFEGEPLDDYRDWAMSHEMWEPIPGGGESRAQVVTHCCRGLRTVLGCSERTVLVVSHELLLSDVLNAVRGQSPPPVGEHLPYATPFRLASEHLERALQVLELWLLRTTNHS